MWIKVLKPKLGCNGRKTIPYREIYYRALNNLGPITDYGPIKDRFRLLNERIKNPFGNLDPSICYLFLRTDPDPAIII